MTFEDDPFKDSRMSLGEHIEVLRRHLLRALVGFLVALVAGFFLAPWVLALITTPVDRELAAFHDRRLREHQRRLAEGDKALVEANVPRAVPLELKRGELHSALGLGPPAQDDWVRLEARIPPLDWAFVSTRAAKVLQRPSLSALTVTEPFTVYFKVSIYCGLVLASPWIFYQLWSFVAAGLYPHEKRWVHRSLPLSVGLFLAGVALCQFVVLPAGVAYLLSYHDWLGVEPELRLSDWLNFALVMPLVFGCCFQTPLAMLVLERIGLFSTAAYRGNRRLAAFLLTLLAAVVSPTPDAVNLLWLAGPLYALYEVGILLCRFAPVPPAEEEEGALVEA